MSGHLRSHLFQFLQNEAKDHDLAVTLTMKQQDGPTTLDQTEAEKNLRHFLNRLNKKAFGNAARRHGRKISVAPMLERSLSGRLHYHLSLKNPFAEFSICRSAVEECWTKTRWGYNEVDVQEIHDVSGWHRYITKAPSLDGWDITNTHLVR